MAEDPKAPETQPVPAQPAPLPYSTSSGKDKGWLPPLPESTHAPGAVELPDPTKKSRRVKTLVTVALALLVTVGTALGVPVCSIAQSWGVELVGCVAPAAPAAVTPTP